MLEQYRISDFIEWHREKKLKLNPDFQRGSVWVPAARVYLIDTILRELPVPKIYLRTTIDTERQVSVREVVDGQQRLKAILDFASDGFRLTARTKEFSGLNYSELAPEYKSIFLEYPIAVEQLLNASENDVLEVFARLNSYNVTLNPAEKRHARFQGKFKWHVREMSRQWSALWTDFGLMSTRQRVRMEDDVTMAQFLMIAEGGIMDGGADKIDKFYKQYDESYPNQDGITKVVNDTCQSLVELFAPTIKGTKLGTTPQLVVLFGALAHRLHGIPQGDYDGQFPDGKVGIGPDEKIKDNLQTIAAALEADEPPQRLKNFVTRSASTTQRISSRQVRFDVFYKALGPDTI